MLNIKKCVGREEKHGDYYIELIDIKDIDACVFSKLGYYCDKAHLRAQFERLMPFMKELGLIQKENDPLPDREQYYHLLHLLGEIYNEIARLEYVVNNKRGYCRASLMVNKKEFYRDLSSEEALEASQQRAEVILEDLRQLTLKLCER